MALESNGVMCLHRGAEESPKDIDVEDFLCCAARMMFWPTFDVGLVTRKGSVRDVAKDD